MADNQSPEEELNSSTGSQPEAEPAQEEFPPKLRVHAAARLLGITSKEVLAHLESLGFVARSAHSSIDRSAAERVRDIVRSGGDVPPAEPETEEAAAADTAKDAPADGVAAESAPSLFSALDVPAPVASRADAAPAASAPLFLPPSPDERAPRKERPAEAEKDRKKAGGKKADDRDDDKGAGDAEKSAAPSEGEEGSPSGQDDDDAGSGRRRRRGRRGRGRGRGEGEQSDSDDSKDESGGEHRSARATKDGPSKEDGSSSKGESPEVAASEADKGDKTDKNENDDKTENESDTGSESSSDGDVEDVTEGSSPP
ncbi:translation initiation factor IF-2 N-terminal domain-containing protein, partial [Tsukamurella sp. 8J]|uniref:translation initiation factor IF-2 N-terminal domain-containing protein n=1 Tax=Tsukamurella sp. 8J TaxID=3031962 RepID=UPI0023BA20D5